MANYVTRELGLLPQHCCCTRYDKKITVILISQVSCPLENSPFQVLYTYTSVLSNPRYTFGIAISSCFDFSFLSSIVAKRFPLIGIFSFGKRKKSAGPSPVNMVVEP